MKRCVAILVVAVGATACSSNGLSSLPLPAPTVGSGGYRITAVFSNALNLPASAKVKLAGADVGQMESMVARNYTAVTTIRIMDGVRLPQGSTAELRSATPLGDVFIALKPPPGASPATPLLKDGDTIGLDNTAAAATVESVLSSAAVMVNGGAVRNLTNIINGMGKATGDQGQAFGDIIAKTNGTLAKLTARSDQISDALTETSRLAHELDAKNQALTEVMVAAGPATDTLAANADAVADVVRQAGDTSKQLEKFPSVAGTDTSGRSVIGDANTIARSWNDLVLAPDANLAALNRLMPPIIKATASNAFSVRASIDRLVLGSMPDAGFLGDPGFHGPKRYDWAQMVGSFKYTLWRLQQRVVGSGPGVPQVPVLPSPTDPGQVIVAPPGPAPGPPPSEPPP
ncbi:MlaD family protein [Mycolicibacterium aichiense]|uniref:Mammalian cell entry protein n=2 Tax=Mycolicibacterium TaxID=1866885 RepID=A0AAD1HW31_9MYCO|nr:MlaD family protein [Mycolicibacterium aichiense]MCV7016308.1 MCE family protein [Mycolicibacterium aichiense]BBX09921.1 mammalian cell entry protein [Mycolicibacterium aichiense]STZ26413.1 Mce family protein, Mce5E [Mycolicibacterium aichiense]